MTFTLLPRVARPLMAALLLGFLVASAAPLSAQTLRVRPLVRDGEVLVSFALDGVFTDDMRAIVQSGLRTTITYIVDLKVKVPGWVDRTVATAVVSTSVEYDNLTRQHTVSQTLDGRMQDSRVIEDESLVRQRVTSFERLPLFKTGLLVANREYYLIVRADARPQSRSAFWPWGGATSGQAKFTFIP